MFARNTGTVRALTALLALAALAGCGLKGPLTLPERAGNVVIRGPQTPAPETPAPAATPPPAEPPPADTGPPP